MRKIVILNLLIILILSFSSCKEKEYVRLRIVADNDLEESIINKNTIKETIKCLFDEGKISYEDLTVEMIDYYLKQNLSSDLYNSLVISYKVSYYPAKTFNNKMIASGNYETLLIEIGAANGHNFWTLLYPEYYGYEFEETNEIEYRSHFLDLFN
jgi:stage II sporulation protein R